MSVLREASEQREFSTCALYKQLHCANDTARSTAQDASHVVGSCTGSGIADLIDSTGLGTSTYVSVNRTKELGIGE